MTALAVVCTWFATTASAAVAQQSRPAQSGRVRLELTGCPGVPMQAVRRVLSVELGDLLLDPSEGEAPEADTLIIRCAGNLASVEATGGGEPPIERILPLDDFPGDAAPRALALLGVELLAARSAAVRERIMRRQIGPAAAATFEPVGAPPPSPPPAPAERDARIGVTGVWRTFGARDGASVLGGRIEASSTAMKFGLASGDLELAAGRKDVANVGQTTAWLISGGATYGLFAGGRRWRAAVGLGARIGLVRESGSSADPARITSSTFVRPWGGPMLSATLSRTLGRAALTVGGEAGWSLSSIDEMAAGVTAIAVRGPWVAVSVGADLRR